MELPKIIQDVKDRLTDPETRHEIIDAAKHLKDALVHNHPDQTEENATEATNTPE